MIFSTRAPAHRHASRLALAAALLLLSAPTLFAHGFKVGDLEIQHPWSRATPAGAKVAAGYLVVVNHGATPDRLVSVTAGIAGKSEIHEMKVTDGVMTMRPVEGGVEVPARGEVKLEPGSYHIMFMELNAQPKVGMKIPGTLTFEKAGTVNVEFSVDPASGSADPGHGG